MSNQIINGFFITGISIRTSNENGRAAADIPALWQKFFSENIMEQLTGKTSRNIYCVYTDYEKDFTKPYTVVLGCAVEAEAPVPAGFERVAVQPGNYNRVTAKGNIQNGIVFRAWNEIWNSPLQRIYTTDFEVYGEKALDPANAEVDIFVAIQQHV